MITSQANERIKAARKLHSRQHRHRSGKLLLEGVRLIADAVDSGLDPECVYFSPEMLSETPESTRLLQTLESHSASYETVSTQVLASLSQTVTPQGIVAVVALPDMAAPEHPTLALVLDGVADPGNAGTLLRSAEAAGADLVVFGPGSVDAYNDKVMRAGMGAHFRLPIRVCADWPAVASVLGDGVRTYVADAGAALAYDAVDWTEAAALIVGSEAHGPSSAARALAREISIPMQGPVESLNAAMAGAVILFEAARQRKVMFRRSVDTSEISGVS